MELFQKCGVFFLEKVFFFRRKTFLEVEFPFGFFAFVLANNSVRRLYSLFYLYYTYSFKVYKGMPRFSI